jgi:hypothetical protein
MLAPILLAVPGRCLASPFLRNIFLPQTRSPNVVVLSCVSIGHRQLFVYFAGSLVLRSSSCAAAEWRLQISPLKSTSRFSPVLQRLVFHRSLTRQYFGRRGPAHARGIFGLAQLREICHVLLMRKLGLRRQGQANPHTENWAKRENGSSSTLRQINQRHSTPRHIVKMPVCTNSPSYLLRGLDGVETG